MKSSRISGVTSPSVSKKDDFAIKRSEAVAFQATQKCTLPPGSREWHEFRETLEDHEVCAMFQDDHFQLAVPLTSSGYEDFIENSLTATCRKILPVQQRLQVLLHRKSKLLYTRFVIHWRWITMNGERYTYNFTIHLEKMKRARLSSEKSHSAGLVWSWWSTKATESGGCERGAQCDSGSVVSWGHGRTPRTLALLSTGKTGKTRSKLLRIVFCWNIPCLGTSFPETGRCRVPPGERCFYVSSCGKSSS